MKPPAPLAPARLSQLLAIPDLTGEPGHAIGLMVKTLGQGLLSYPPAHWIGGDPIVDAAHNYTLLGYPEDAIVQDGTYTHWVDDKRMLRTQTTALILQDLLRLSGCPQPATLLAPGLVYRRDIRDRWHCAQPHQMDIWVLLPKEEESPKRLMAMVHDVAGAGIPGVDLDIRRALHPYTEHGIEINARWQNQWLEVGEAGLIAPALLERMGIDSTRWGGLAMGLGIDRWVMVRKGLPDIRLLRDPLPAIARQMGDLTPWRAISRQPSASRELSLVCAAGHSEEDLVERVLEALGTAATLVQSVQIQGRWLVSALPPASRDRLGADADQENLLLRLTWQAEGASLPREQVNTMARTVYRALHEGRGWTYCP